MQSRLISRFAPLGETAFLAQVGCILSAMTDNTHFPEPWPSPAPALADLQSALDRYRSAYEASMAHDLNRIAERQIAREALTALIQKLAAYVEFAAQEDELALRSSGFEIRRSNGHRAHVGPLEAPTGLQLSHGASSGQIELRLDRLDGARSYEIQTAQGDPAVENNWHHALVSSITRRINLEGLSPMQWAWVRVRGVDGVGAGRWSEPASIVVL